MIILSLYDISSIEGYRYILMIKLVTLTAIKNIKTNGTR